MVNSLDAVGEVPTVGRADVSEDDARADTLADDAKADVSEDDARADTLADDARADVSEDDARADTLADDVRADVSADMFDRFVSKSSLATCNTQ